MANPVKFEGHNLVIAEDQPEYLPLPAHLDQEDPHMAFTTCWELSAEELEEVKKTGKVYVQFWTFGKGVQPMKVAATFPVP